MDDMHDVKEALRAFILSKYLVGESPDQLKDDTPLLTSGVLDSMARIALVSFVEEQFGFEVEPHEAGVGNFDTIQDMAGFVARKRVGGS